MASYAVAGLVVSFLLIKSWLLCHQAKRDLLAQEKLSRDEA